MTSMVRVAAIASAIVVVGSMCSAQHGPTPRPAEKPPEYGCRLLDLNTAPAAVRDGERIGELLLKITCPEKTRPVDIEIRNERFPGVDPVLVKVATDVVLEKGERTLRLAGGGLAQGGRYITSLKAKVPEGKKEIMRRVDTATCKGWELTYVEKVKEVHVPGCTLQLHTDPRVFKTSERINAFVLSTRCERRREKLDIKVSWEPLTGGQRQLVKVATDAVLPAGQYTTRLMGGGVGRQGHYILEIESISSGVWFKTACTAWTLAAK